MIETSLTATVEDDVVRLAVTVTNAGDEPATLRFRSGQRAEFVVRRVDRGATDGDRTADGNDRAADCNDRAADCNDESVVWRYGEGRLFTQVLGSETLDPGASTTYEATWPDPGPGTYEVVGEVVADEGVPTAKTGVTVE